MKLIMHKYEYYGTWDDCYNYWDNGPKNDLTKITDDVDNDDDDNNNNNNYSDSDDDSEDDSEDHQNNTTNNDNTNNNDDSDSDNDSECDDDNTTNNNDVSYGCTNEMFSLDNIKDMRTRIFKERKN